MPKNKRPQNDDSGVPNRGRGGGGGRGRGRGRGTPRGRGGFGDSPLRGGPPGRGAPSPRAKPVGRGGYISMQEVDVDIQQYQSSGSGYNTPRGRGRGSTPMRGAGGNLRGSFDYAPRGSPRGRGRGRGGFKQKLPPGAPLSNLLYEDRPLLRPVIFVRSQHTAKLFEEAEDIFEPVVESSTQAVESHVPTANKVTRIFSGTPPTFEEDAEPDEEIEEVDFADLGRILQQVDDAAKNNSQTSVIEVEEKFTGFYIDTKPSPVYEDPANSDIGGDTGPPSNIVVEAVEETMESSIKPTENLPPAIEVISTHTQTLVPGNASIPEVAVETKEENVSGFYIDTTPSLQQSQDPVTFHSASRGEPLGVILNDDDDVIIYDAPNPRSGPATPGPAIPAKLSLAEISFDNSPRQSGLRKMNPLRRGTFFERVSRKGKGKVARRRLSGHPGFGTFGAMMEEARLHQEEEDPKKEERRRGDSDIEWGDEDEEVETEGNAAGLAEGMDLDPDLVGSGISITALKSFVHGVSGEGSQHLTMDDLADIQQMKEEQASSDSDGIEDDAEADEEAELISDEEMKLVAEFDAENSFDDEDSSDEDGSPKSSFQARLDRLRKRQQKAKGTQDDDDDDEMADIFWEGDSLDDHALELLDENSFTVGGRKARTVFQAIHDGYFDFAEPAIPSSKKGKDLPPELQEQWNKDRAKKAESKKQRELDRLIAIMDPSIPKKGGKKSRKATIAASRLDPSIEIPNYIVDMMSLEKQIRKFLADPNRSNMALPATDKETRKKIHTLGAAFNLKSKSKDGMTGRYTTLIKNKHSGRGLNEKKIASLMKGFKARASFDGPGYKGKGKQGSLGGPQTQDGDVVGHTAPKIDQSNIGFQMLSSMGWADGDTIGLSGGLDAPIAAVIKKTKLGLGALKSHG